MTTWRERLCGSEVLKGEPNEQFATLKQFMNPTRHISCGGGYFPMTQNVAKMNNSAQNFVLPTTQYSILVFKTDGTAVIYSDTEHPGMTEDIEVKTDPIS